MKTIRDLAELVDGMRVRQRSYFRTRDPEMLKESKTYEHQVDGAIAAILADETGLFAEEKQ